MTRGESAVTELRPMEAKTETKADQPLKVCFVCSGNTCRSPMAAAVANHLAKAAVPSLPKELQALAQPPLVAFSAGLYANEGEPIAPNAANALEEAGIPSLPPHSYRNHRAHTVTDQEAEQYDLIVGLTRRHAMMLWLKFPALASRITFLPIDIADPYGGDAQHYRQCLEEITKAVQERFFAAEEETK